MDTWNVARMILDSTFAIVIVSFVAVFFYRREKRIRSLIAQYVMKAADQPAPMTAREFQREQVYEPQVTHRPVMPRNSKPDLVAQYESQRNFAPAPQPAPAARKASRAEKYLEAVRMYRQGSRREDIEKSLGISFMELELLGQLK